MYTLLIGRWRFEFPSCLAFLRLHAPSQIVSTVFTTHTHWRLTHMYMYMYMYTHTYMYTFSLKRLSCTCTSSHMHVPPSPTHNSVSNSLSLSPSLSLSLAYCDFWWFCSADVFGSCGIVLSIEALVGRYSWQPRLENTVWKTNLSKIPIQVYGEENKK